MANQSFVEPMDKMVNGDRSKQHTVQLCVLSKSVVMLLLACLSCFFVYGSFKHRFLSIEYIH